MLLEAFQVDDFQGALLTGFQFYLGSQAGFESFLPSGCAKTPAVSFRQPREIEFGVGGTQVVAYHLAEGEKLVRYDAAHDVSAVIVFVGFAGTVPQPPGSQLVAT